MNDHLGVSDSIPLLDNYVYENSLQASTEGEGWRLFFSQVIKELKQLCIIAFPMIITGFLIYGKSAISMLFMGKLGKEALAGGSLSIGIANITGYSIISGLAMGIEAICSQACGAKQWPFMGQTLQRIIIILSLTCIPISLLWLNFEPLLIFCGQEPAISSVASIYLAFSIPDLAIQSVISPLRIFLRAQNITLPILFSAAFALAFHAPINYILVYHLNFGIQGIAVAMAITDLNLLGTILLYLRFTGICRRSWKGWTLKCFKEWKPIIVLAIPSCISVCLEWWWYELMIVLSSLLANAPEAVATMGILIQATSLVYIFPSSISLAVSTRVGNELGANQPKRAKRSSMVALSCATVISFIAMFFMTSMRHAWGQFFTTDDGILSLTTAVMPVVGLCELGNFPQTIGCGVLRGTARPTLGVNINLCSFYGVGFPVAIFLGFVIGLGLVGLWFGLLAAQFICAMIMALVLTRTDWKMQACRATEVTGNGAENEAETETETQEGLMSIILVE